MTDQIEFLTLDAPPLADGDYVVHVEQAVYVGKGASSTDFGGSQQDISFSVQGPRFSLPVADVHSVFPPEGSRGDHSTALAHVVLERSTLPWERPVEDHEEGDPPEPWLAVVLIDQSELDDGTALQPDPVKLSALDPVGSTLRDTKGRFVGSFGTLEHGQASHDLVAVLDVQQQLLLRMLPRVGDDGDLDLSALRWQQHVRRRLHFQFDSAVLGAALGNDTAPDPAVFAPIFAEHDVALGDAPDVEALPSRDGWAVDDPHTRWVVRHLPDGDHRFGAFEPTRAVVFGNRLPRPGARSTAHLVSVENLRGHEDALEGLDPDALVRLVSLRSWSFSCDDHHGTFDGLLGALQFPPAASSSERRPAALALPSSDDGDAPSPAAAYLAAGFVPLEHRVRGGQTTVSVYRGPLAPRRPTVGPARDARCADDLYRLDRSNGIFDVSYASAWELGRLLLLQSRGTATALHGWKRDHRHIRRIADHDELHAHLVGARRDPLPAGDEHDLPDKVVTWFRDLHLLRGVPFHYLVPDERMLPVESIRFFELDQRWVECLVDGAFAADHVLDDDHDHADTLRSMGDPGGGDDAALDGFASALHPDTPTSGFLLRSHVVTGWPGMQVDGSPNPLESSEPLTAAERMEVRRLDRLSDSILLCLFKGDVRTVDLHLRPEVLHFGFEPTANDGQVVKRPRGDDGRVERDESEAVMVTLDARTARIDQLVSDTGAADPADFARTMIEGAPRVRFVLGT